MLYYYIIISKLPSEAAAHEEQNRGEDGDRGADDPRCSYCLLVFSIVLWCIAVVGVLCLWCCCVFSLYYCFVVALMILARSAAFGCGQMGSTLMGPLQK